MRRLLLLVVAAAGCSAPRGEPSISSFAITPSTFVLGETTQLEWQANNVESCTITPDVGKVSAVGATSVTPNASGRYTLRCGESSITLGFTVKQPVRIESFTVTPAVAVADSEVVLAWNATDTTGCDLSGVGAVDAQGSSTVYPVTTTTWQLTCEGLQGPAVGSARVEITPATSLAAPTGLQAVGGEGMLTLSWKQAAGAANVYFAEVSGVLKTNVDTVAGGVVFRKVRSPFDVSGLVNGRNYFFVAAAVSAAVESVDSAEASGSPRGGPATVDPFFKDQWHLTNTGQAGGIAGEDIRTDQAWAQGFKGEGVRVAIVDEGIDFDHEDLRTNVATSRSFDYLGNATVDLAQHGTCVAGLVSARDENGVGLKGVAPRSNLVSYNVLQDLTAANELDAMTRDEKLNWVSNNSWGEVDDGTGLFTFPELAWLQGVAEGTQKGRAGLGTVYCWAAGNGGDASHLDNANYDGQANSRFVFAIGGVGDDGRKVSYSEDGANVLVVTPTMGRGDHGLSTADITGALGYNDGSIPNDYSDGNYTDLMDGTSGSTPIAAGVAALVLQANPQLTWRDVRRVLAYSARKNDPGDGDWATNLAGLHVNHKYGFGVTDANAAVLTAKSFTPGAVEKTTATPLESPMLAIPDNDLTGVSSALTVAGSEVGHVEFVEITLSVAHPRSGDLEISLGRETGPVDLLAVPHSCSKDRITHTEHCSVLSSWMFGSVRHLDEPADGTWTLTVKDRIGGNTGTLQSWKLTFWGRP